MIKVGDTVIRIFGDDFMRTEMRVCAVDDSFIYCNAQKPLGSPEWTHLPEGSEPWKFNAFNGVETDEGQGWGVVGEDGKILCLSRLMLG